MKIIAAICLASAIYSAPVKENQNKLTVGKCCRYATAVCVAVLLASGQCIAVADSPLDEVALAMAVPPVQPQVILPARSGSDVRPRKFSQGQAPPPQTIALPVSNAMTPPKDQNMDQKSVRELQEEASSGFDGAKEVYDYVVPYATGSSKSKQKTWDEKTTIEASSCFGHGSVVLTDEKCCYVRQTTIYKSANDEYSVADCENCHCKQVGNPFYGCCQATFGCP